VALARGRQVNKPGWAAARRKEIARASKRTRKRGPEIIASSKPRRRAK